MRLALPKAAHIFTGGGIFSLRDKAACLQLPDRDQIALANYVRFVARRADARQVRTKRARQALIKGGNTMGFWNMLLHTLLCIALCFCRTSITRTNVSASMMVTTLLATRSRRLRTFCLLRLILLCALRVRRPASCAKRTFAHGASAHTGAS